MAPGPTHPGKAGRAGTDRVCGSCCCRGATFQCTQSLSALRPTALCPVAARPPLWLAVHPTHLSLLLPVSSEARCPWKVVSGGRPIRSQAAAGPTFPFLSSPCGPSRGLGAVSAVDLRESLGPPLAPPTKRHCRSLSEPDELARCRSPWRPGGSKVWTLVSKRRCHSGGSTSLPGTTESLGRTFPVAGPTSPPAPRPASASSGFVDSRGGGSGPPRCPVGPCALSSRRRLSLSQERLADAGTAPCTPEPGRRLRLPRSRSQPCVLLGRKSRLKRRREEDAQWPRPSLDFLKMTRVRLFC